MSIGDIFNAFRGGSQQQPMTPAQAAQAAASGAMGSAAANPAVPSAATPASDGSQAAAIPPAGKGEASPLENYQKLWDKADTDPKPLDPVVRFNADPAKVMQAAQQIDITKAIDPALLARVNAGNDPAALVELINKSVQVGIAHSTQSTTGIVNEALKQQNDKYTNDIIPEILRRERIQNTTRADNPLFTNPAVAPIMSMVESQLMIKFPTASPAEISEKAKEYIGGLGSAVLESQGLVASAKPVATTAVGGVEDWSKWATKS